MSNFAAEYDAAVASIAAVFAGRQDYAVIGGLALAFHGVPRATQNIDLLLSLPRMELPPILEALASNGFSFDIHGVLCELRDQQLSQIRFKSIRIDLLAASLPLFATIAKSAGWESLGEHRLRVASAEGLILLKLIAFRLQDQADLLGLLAANRQQLDMVKIREWYAIVGETGDARWHAFEELMRQVDAENSQLNR